MSPRRFAPPVALLLVTVSFAPVYSESPPLTMEQHWANLAGIDTATALRSLHFLAQRPKESVPFVAKQLHSLLAEATPERIARLIDDLDSPTFAARQKAARDLEAILEEAAPYLQRVLNLKPSLEVRRRVELLLSRRRAESTLSARRFQALRAIALLEHLGTPEARKFLKAMSVDGKEEWAASEARAADERLDQKEKPSARWEDLAEADVGQVARAFLALSTLPKEDCAGPEELRKVLEIAEQLPPFGLRSRGITAQQVPHDMLCYRKEVMSAYRADGKNNRLREGVRAAVRALNENEKLLTFEEEFPAMPLLQLNQAKQTIEMIQKNKIGEAIFFIQKAAEELEALEGDRAGETKLWQANHDYVLARLYARQAWLIEYSVKLGEIRRDYLPALAPERDRGWRLTFKRDLSDQDAKKLVDRTRRLLQRITEEHPGSPWQVMANNEINSFFGLEWVPLAR